MTDDDLQVDMTLIQQGSVQIVHSVTFGLEGHTVLIEGKDGRISITADSTQEDLATILRILAETLEADDRVDDD